MMLYQEDSFKLSPHSNAYNLNIIFLLPDYKNMSSTAAKILAKSFNSPDDLIFEKGKIEIVNFADIDVTIRRARLEPERNWSKCIRPLVNTDSCRAPYISYIISGGMKVTMDDGTEVEGKPGDTYNEELC